MTLTYSRYNPEIKLSSEEMLAISQEINLEFAPDVSITRPNPDYQQKLSSEEMLAISQEIRHRFAPKASDNTKELVLLPVDPEHLYAYWNLGDDIINATQKIDSENQLTLRIYPEPNTNTDTTQTKPWFDVAIEGAQAQQKIFLPSRKRETAYSATIGKRYPGNSFAPFASSNITHVPLGKAIAGQIKESQIVFKPMPPFIKPSREIFIYTNNSASGQGKIQ